MKHGDYLGSIGDYWTARAELERAAGGPLTAPLAHEKAIYTADAQNERADHAARKIASSRHPSGPAAHAQDRKMKMSKAHPFVGLQPPGNREREQ
jgi:hypothetical protein